MIRWRWSRSVVSQTVAYQASLSMGFSRQEYWSGLSFPSPGDLPNPGIEPWSPALEADALTSEPPGKPNWWYSPPIRYVSKVISMEVYEMQLIKLFPFQWEREREREQWITVSSFPAMFWTAGNRERKRKLEIKPPGFVKRRHPPDARHWGTGCKFVK